MIRKETGGEVWHVPADMTKADDIQRNSSTKAPGHFGRLDVVVDNARRSASRRFHEIHR